MHLEYYEMETLTKIVLRSADILNVKCELSAAREIASRSRGTPRIANALLRRVRDFAQVKGSGEIDKAISCYALEALNIDRYGLDQIDNKLLTTIIDKFNGGPVGLTTIATALGRRSRNAGRGLRAFPYQRRLYQTYAPRPRGDGVGLYPFGTASPRWNTKFVIFNCQLSIVNCF